MTAKLLQTLKGAFLFFVVCYLALWLIVYSALQDFDYSQLFRFMQDAWYGDVEVPAFIQAFALSVSALFTLVFLFVISLQRR
jgi:hypothetical protein